MAKKTKPAPILLRWSQYVPLSEVQDPLGLGLRGSTRLASRLLHCITSITRRARYFSFIPWCVRDYHKREKGKPYGLGLRDAIVLREKALTLACVAHHDGEACRGGALVGMREARKWFAKGHEQANFKRLTFAKVPALDAYFNSLVNLGIFVTEEEIPETDEAIDEEPPEPTFDDVQLSPLGEQLATAYGSLIGRLSSVRELVDRRRTCSVKNLAEWGKRGGLCELADDSAPDRGLLRDMFFSLINQKGDSHPFRRKSLLLILDLARQLGPDNWILNERAFASAVYFGEIADEEGRLVVSWPTPLMDIATRWRMFYFHHFMSVALEGMFSWLVSNLNDKGLAGATVESLVNELNSATVRTTLKDRFGARLRKAFGNSSPADLFDRLGVSSSELTSDLSRQLDHAITEDSDIAEASLEYLIRDNTFLQSPVGLAIPMVLLSLTLGRYIQWETTRFGNWLAKAANDPYLDLIPPVLTDGLVRRFGNWWVTPWKDLADFVLSRYVVRQHIALSYEKTAIGDRCLLQVDGDKVISSASYDRIGMGNPRFHSAVQILKDLALLDDDDNGVTVPTKEGQQLLDAQLSEELKHEVS